MKLLKRISGLSNIKNTIVAVGVFDGVHRGHKKILRRALEVAHSINARSIVLTFHPHPDKVLRPASNIPLLTSPSHKAYLISRLGIDVLLDLPFTSRIASMEPEIFVKGLLVNKLHAKGVVVGRDFVFGYKAKGNFKTLASLGRRLGFKVYVVEPLTYRKRKISSSAIRRAIEKGRLGDASAMLGRPVSIFGTVVRGRGVGRILGFPTANIDPHHEAIPPSGVYTVDARVAGKIRAGILNIGKRPTFASKRKTPAIELYIFNFRKNIYGACVEIIFKRMLRRERKFKSAKELKKQIEIDIQRANTPPNI